MSTQEKNQTTIPLADVKKEEQQQDPAQADYQSGQNFLAQEGSLAQAANAFHNALIGFQRTDNQGGVANANDKLGDICLERKEHEKALAHYQQALDICRAHDDLFSMLALRKKIALCHRGLMQYDMAVDIYLDLLDTYESMNSPGSTVETIIQMGETYKESGALQKAVDAYKTAASIHANYKHSKHAQALLDKAAAIEKEMRAS